MGGRVEGKEEKNRGEAIWIEMREWGHTRGEREREEGKKGK